MPIVVIVYRACRPLGSYDSNNYASSIARLRLASNGG
jgi:hypothetical protein